MQPHLARAVHDEAGLERDLPIVNAERPIAGADRGAARVREDQLPGRAEFFQRQAVERERGHGVVHVIERDLRGDRRAAVVEKAVPIQAHAAAPELADRGGAACGRERAAAQDHRLGVGDVVAKGGEFARGQDVDRAVRDRRIGGHVICQLHTEAAMPDDDVVKRRAGIRSPPFFTRADQLEAVSARVEIEPAGAAVEVVADRRADDRVAREIDRSVERLVALRATAIPNRRLPWHAEAGDVQNGPGHPRRRPAQAVRVECPAECDVNRRPRRQRGDVCSAEDALADGDATRTREHAAQQKSAGAGLEKRARTDDARADRERAQRLGHADASSAPADRDVLVRGRRAARVFEHSIVEKDRRSGRRCAKRTGGSVVREQAAADRAAAVHAHLPGEVVLVIGEGQLARPRFRNSRRSRDAPFSAEGVILRRAHDEVRRRHDRLEVHAGRAAIDKAHGIRVVKRVGTSVPVARGVDVPRTARRRALPG